MMKKLNGVINNCKYICIVKIKLHFKFHNVTIKISL